MVPVGQILQLKVRQHLLVHSRILPTCLSIICQTCVALGSPCSVTVPFFNRQRWNDRFFWHDTLSSVSRTRPFQIFRFPTVPDLAPSLVGFSVEIPLRGPNHLRVWMIGEFLQLRNTPLPGEIQNRGWLRARQAGTVRHVLDCFEGQRFQNHQFVFSGPGKLKIVVLELALAPQSPQVRTPRSLFQFPLRPFITGRAAHVR